MITAEYMDVYDKAKAVIQEWVDKQGHNRCHYYPELFEKLAVLYNINVPVGFYDLPPEKEFEIGCNTFRIHVYDAY